MQANATSALEVTAVPALPARSAGANKGNFGRVLVVAGSRGMSGAAVLCASGALRGGAGLVRAAVPASVLPLVAAANPCYMTAPLSEDPEGRIAGAARDELADNLRWATVVAIGPGLGTSAELPGLVEGVLERAEVPTVLDADGLNNIAGRLDVLRRRSQPLVITPHPGEFARLAGCEIAAVQASRPEAARNFAALHRVVVVLKGHGTVVTDGRRVYVNSTGNPGMATGGTGDVLTGLTAALLAQGLETFAAAQLAVYLHGLAGDLASVEFGEASLLATDLVAYLPRAFQARAGGTSQRNV